MSEQDATTPAERSVETRRELLKFGIAQYEDGVRDGLRSILESLKMTEPIIALRPELVPGVEFTKQLVQGALDDKAAKKPKQ